MRRSVAEATIYEYGRVKHREDISWVLTQNSSFKIGRASCRERVYVLV